MDRRKFLIGGSLLAFSVSALGSVLKTDNGEFIGDCETTNDILGPFYRPDAPIRSDLTFKGLEGNTIALKGRVFKSDCKTIIEDALLEIWHCNTQGEYDNESEEFMMRGRQFSNKAGEYNFKTILPGKYLNGRLYRPAHIHFRISAKGYQEIISQIYFAGDPHIHADPWASQNKAKNRILPIFLEDTQGNLSVVFDIFLKDKK